MTNGNGPLTNGWAATVRLALQMLGHTGLIVVCVIVLIYVASGGKLPGQMGKPSATDSAISAVSAASQSAANEAEIIRNQHLIIDILNENQKVAYRQSVILDNMAHILDKLEDRR